MSMSMSAMVIGFGFGDKRRAIGDGPTAKGREER
jgi:hypothetical protein